MADASRCCVLMEMYFAVIRIKRMIVDEFIPRMDVGMGVTMRMDMGIYAGQTSKENTSRNFQSAADTDGAKAVQRYYRAGNY